MTDPAPASSPARLLGMFLRPDAVLASLAVRPTVWLALLALGLTVGTFQATVVPRVDLEGEIRAALGRSGQEMSDEQVETLVERAEKARWVQPVITAVVVPGAVVMVALLLWLGTRLAGSQAGYHAVLAGTAHALWPPVLVKSLVGMVVVSRYRVLPVGESEHLIRSNLAAFLPPDTPAATSTLAGYLDVFVAWGAVLVVLALMRIAGLSARRAVAVVAILGGVWVAVRVVAVATFAGGAS